MSPDELWQQNGARFLKKLDLNGLKGCMPWKARVGKMGIGWFMLKIGDRKKNCAHHIAAWHLWRGTPPNHRIERIVARCGNPLCCNIEHLHLARNQGLGVGRAAPAPYAEKVEKRFWSKVERGGDDVCWPYKAARKSGRRLGVGYLNMKIDGKHTSIPAHRYAYQLKHGRLSRDTWVLHRCQNKACCNPAHLFAGQQGFYVRGHGQQFEPCGTRGEDKPFSKLKEADISQIFAWYHHDGLSQSEIARRLHVAPSTIHHVIRGNTWRHVSTTGQL